MKKILTIVITSALIVLMFASCIGTKPDYGCKMGDGDSHMSGYGAKYKK